MLKTTSLIIALIFTTGIAVAQISVSNSNSNSTNTVKTKTEFVSVEGEFAIALPQDSVSSINIEPLEGKTKGGKQFIGETTQGLIWADYVDLYKPEDGRAVAEKTMAELMELILSKGGKLISKKEISFQGNSGLEINMRLVNGMGVIQRQIIVGKRIYTLMAQLGETPDGAEQIKVLDSFQLLDKKTVIARQLEIKTALAKKIEENTPQSLPQTPVAEKLKSDAEDEGVKGKVKSIIVEREELSVKGTVVSRRMSETEDYNEKGNRLKRVAYDDRGNPYYITVYGYIDGARVSNSEGISYDYNGPKVMVRPQRTIQQPEKPADTRYQTKYEYKYENGKLVYMQLISNRDVKGMLYVYNYNGNQKENLVYTSDGNLNQKYLSVFDDKGIEIEWTHFDILVPKVYGDAKYMIKTESFDKKGNWTKRIFSRLVTENGKEVYKPSFTKYRTITYYP